jgi:hypothetical protein
MRIKTLEKLKFKLSGRSVPVIKMLDIQVDGQIRGIQFLGEVKDRPNSLISTWDEKGWEKDRDSQMVTLIGESGVKTIAHVVSEFGNTINLYTHPVQNPRLEDVIGHAATMDDIADSMDLGKSMRNLLIGALIGVGLGAFIIGPMLTKMLS